MEIPLNHGLESIRVRYRVVAWLHWYSTFIHVITKDYWGFYSGAEVASLALLCYAPITYVLASASTFTSVSSLLVNILATSGPYYFLQQKPLTIQPPRRQNLDWNGWWLRWIYSATAAVLYSLVIHKAAKWVLPQIRKYFPLARHALRESDLNWKWLLCSIPFLSIAVWNLFRVPNLPQHRITENTKGKGSEKGRIYWLEDLRIIKRISVVFFLSSVLTWVQLKAKSEVL